MRLGHPAGADLAAGHVAGVRPDEPARRRSRSLATLRRVAGWAHIIGFIAGATSTGLSVASSSGGGQIVGQAMSPSSPSDRRWPAPRPRGRPRATAGYGPSRPRRSARTGRYRPCRRRGRATDSGVTNSAPPWSGRSGRRRRAPCRAGSAPGTCRRRCRRRSPAAAACASRFIRLPAVSDVRTAVQLVQRQQCASLSARARPSTSPSVKRRRPAAPSVPSCRKRRAPARRAGQPVESGLEVGGTMRGMRAPTFLDASSASSRACACGPRWRAHPFLDQRLRRAATC